MENTIDFYESNDLSNVMDNSFEEEDITTNDSLEVVLTNWDELDYVNTIGDGGETCSSVGMFGQPIGDGGETCGSVGMFGQPIGDSGETCGSIGSNQRTFVYNPSFQAREDMLPYEQKTNFDLENGITDPF